MARLVASGVPPEPREARERRLIQRQRRLSKAEMDSVIEDYLAGASAAAVGKKHGIDPQTVLNNLKARGIAARSRSRPTQEGDSSHF